MKILLHVNFIGTKYCGYQVQPNGITVQQRLNEAAKALFGYDCDIVGCSRTDSGVHANEFCVAVTRSGTDALETSVPIEKIPLAMSHLLPEDIAVFRAEEVACEFHPRYDVKYKEYVYKIWNSPIRNPFWHDRAWHCPKKITDEDLVRMNQAAKTWIGTMDFSSYMAANSSVTDAIRTVFEAEVTQNNELITFHVAADGFLYHMVRIFVGTLVEVAYGRLQPEDIPEITRAKDRRVAGPTAPAHGLYLNRVVYKD